MTAPVQKLWNYFNILRDDGLSFRLHNDFDGQDGDYVEQLTFLLFIKMADEQSRAPFPPSPGLRRTGPHSSDGLWRASKPSPILMGFRLGPPLTHPPR